MQVVNETKIQTDYNVGANSIFVPDNISTASYRNNIADQKLYKNKSIASNPSPLTEFDL